MQHGINCRREEGQISEPGDATVRKKAANPFHLIRGKAISFADLKTFVPGLPFTHLLFGHGFSLRRRDSSLYAEPEVRQALATDGVCERACSLMRQHVRSWWELT